ncbi:GcrA family cell cycle regulator [Bradyrhizobium sp. CCBAU 51753]|uniref:GcrA family cell cycle regulator n=1 Tax=Bradyrhizobium sp. CCBAU 51753 TaxID=1325100 RepID=UPI00188CFADD|nr:GcrA family cell cycle regulator [Bradyrhizobium sp. CCBAU 51753]QOZ25313.1 GcrA cell cycle regulator [Bradyrhizobium sp. CCBAU 51753]
MIEPVWTDDRVERLRGLWAKGLSCSQIANELACGFTRSAIIGKAHRLKLPARRDASAGQPSARPAAPPRPPKPGKIASVSQMPTFRPKRNQSNSPAIQREIDAAEPGVDANLTGKPDGRGIKLHQLSDLNCHWPLGDPLTPEFEFCGGKAVPGQPYCAAHCRIAYQAPVARVRTPEDLAPKLNRARPNNYYKR